MLIKLFKLFFGKFIGLDQIPKEYRDEAVKKGIEVLKNMEFTFDPETKSVGVKFKKEL